MINYTSKLVLVYLSKISDMERYTSFFYVEEKGFWRIMNKDHKTFVLMRNSHFTDEQFRKGFISKLGFWNFIYHNFDYQPKEIPDIDPVTFFNRRMVNHRRYITTKKCNLGGYQVDIGNYPFIWCPCKKIVKVIEKNIKKFSIQYANDKLICKDDELSFFVYL